MEISLAELVEFIERSMHFRFTARQCRCPEGHAVPRIGQSQWRMMAIVGQEYLLACAIRNASMRGEE
jgi:hypothetical protein